MLRAILNNSSGDAALSRFTSANTWNAQQIFKAATTTDPAAIFQATGTISAIPAMDANAIAMFQGTEAVTSHVFFSSAASNAHFVFRRRQGTYASPTAVQSGNVLGAFQWQGYGVSTFGSNAAAEIRGVARQNFTESARGTALEFYITANGSTANTQIFVMESALVYATTALQGFASVRASGNAGTVRDFRLTTNTVQRWGIIANATAETGTGNAGSDFEIRRYSDAGADLGLQFAINRQTGNITTNSGGGYFYSLGSLYGQNTIGCIGNSGTTRSIRFIDGNLNLRWALNANNTAESSTATGADFEFRRYNNSGADLGLVMAVTRSTGDITFNGGGGTTTFSANQIAVSTAQTPASATATGTTGTICWDANYIYVCTATNTWKRVAIATWP